MQITEIRVRLVPGRTQRLRAYCSVTFDGEFVVRDIKVIEGDKGYFVAMPSKRLTERCPNCGARNHLKAKFCNECGHQLPARDIPRDQTGKPKLHTDVAHPINAGCRQRLEQAIIDAYKQELERSGRPGYEPAAPNEPFDW